MGLGACYAPDRESAWLVHGSKAARRITQQEALNETFPSVYSKKGHRMRVSAFADKS